MTVVTLAAGVFVVGAAGGAQADRPAPPARPIVLLLHGRGLAGRDTSALRKQWQRALERSIASTAERPLLEEGDVRLVWYADVLDPDANLGCHETMADARGSIGAFGDLQSVVGALGSLLAWAAEGTSGGERTEMRALAGDLLYLSDRGRRCGAEQRLATALADAKRERRPVVLVAHSFGALVAYGHLANARRDTSSEAIIERLVTLGSMLGDAEVRELVFGGSRTDSLSMPHGVRSWINVRDLRDALALPAAPQGGAAGGRIRDVLMESDDERGPHDVIAYLAHPTTGRAVLWAWCDAFADAGGAARPEACTAIADAR